MVVEGQRDAKNVALIPSIRTLADSKLGVDHYRGSASLEFYRGPPPPNCCSKAIENTLLFMIKSRGLHGYL
ncbi:hypothetical protein BHE74_00021631 [Ensete ventricosum]|nr:hypothetical protein GW17_00024134 [Ensete ventricosum]RWW70675.1 hypothetical protein BHE74_00021631 [Ensete ventricosum]